MRAIPGREAPNHLAENGYKTLEVTFLPGWGTEPKKLGKTECSEIRKRIGDLGLVLSTVQESVQLASPNTMVNLGFKMDYSKQQNLERLREAAAVAHQVSAGAPAVIESPVGGRAAAWEETKHEMA